jgi:hypothetical protein
LKIAERAGRAERARRTGWATSTWLAPVAAVLALQLLAARTGSAQPLDLGERRARPIQVAIEISPQELPAQLDHQYSERAVAWFEPGPGPGQATVRIAGGEVERLLQACDPVPGSFGEFVWVFDTATGHVLSATLDGAFRQRVDIGPLHTHVRAEISARMSTLERAGFLRPRSRMGHVVFEHCDAGDAGCNTVAPRALDPFTGYVNAVGKITATVAGGIRTETYSPLGEAVFTEMHADTAVSAR